MGEGSGRGMSTRPRALPEPVAVAPVELKETTSTHKPDFECAMARGLPCDCVEKTGSCHCDSMDSIIITPTYVAKASATAAGTGLSFCEYHALLKK